MKARNGPLTESRKVASSECVNDVSQAELFPLRVASKSWSSMRFHGAFAVVIDHGAARVLSLTIPISDPRPVHASGERLAFTSFRHRVPSTVFGNSCQAKRIW